VSKEVGAGLYAVLANADTNPKWPEMPKGRR
jgi:hypothetical protein